MMEYDHIEIDLYPNGYECELAGFYSRDSSDLQYGINEVKLKIIWLKSSDSHLIFVSMDTLYFPESFASYIYQHFDNKYNISSESIICNATHTHSAPNLSLERFGKISNDYLDSVLTALKDQLPKIGSSFQPSEIFFNSIKNTDNNVVSRRRLVRDVFSYFVKKKALLLPNPVMPIDDCLRFLVIKDMAGDVKAVIYNFSCHPVFATTQSISSDFPGLINNIIESQGVRVSMYLQGFCGDLRPNITSSSILSLTFKSYVKSLLYGSVFRKTTPLDLSDFSSKMSRLICGNFSDETCVVNEFQNRSFSYDFKSATGKICQNAVVKLFSFRNVIGVSIPAEVLSSYYLFLREKFPDIVVFPLGFSEGMIGYLPIHNQLSEGGYEVDSAGNYGWDAPFDQENLEAFLNKLVFQIDQLLSEIKQ